MQNFVSSQLLTTDPIIAPPASRRPNFEANSRAANRMRSRIASPEMFPEAAMLPHLICYRPMFIGGANDEADQHGDA